MIRFILFMITFLLSFSVYSASQTNPDSVTIQGFSLSNYFSGDADPNVIKSEITNKNESKIDNTVFKVFDLSQINNLSLSAVKNYCMLIMAGCKISMVFISKPNIDPHIPT